MVDVTQEILNICQNWHIITTAYNPACNGLIEVFIKVLAVMRMIYKITGMKDYFSSFTLTTPVSKGRQITRRFSYYSGVNVSYLWMSPRQVCLKGQ